MLNITTYQRMQINTTMRYHHITLVRVAIIKKNLYTISAGESMEKREQPYTVGGHVNWCNCYGEAFRSSLKN